MKSAEQLYLEFLYDMKPGEKYSNRNVEAYFRTQQRIQHIHKVTKQTIQTVASKMERLGYVIKPDASEIPGFPYRYNFILRYRTDKPISIDQIDPEKKVSDTRQQYLNFLKVAPLKFTTQDVREYFVKIGFPHTRDNVGSYMNTLKINKLVKSIGHGYWEKVS